MLCGRRTGLWLDERRLVVATCWGDVGHRWECHDPTRDLRWTPGSGTDVSGVRYLIDMADVRDDLGDEAPRDVRPQAGGRSAA